VVLDQRDLAFPDHEDADVVRAGVHDRSMHRMRFFHSRPEDRAASLLRKG
jgi:hypothetical protein